MTNKQRIAEFNGSRLQTRLRLDYRLYKLFVISQERLKIEVKLLLNANRKSYVPRRLVQRRMTLSGLEWPFHASRGISVIAKLLLLHLQCIEVCNATAALMLRCDTSCLHHQSTDSRLSFTGVKLASFIRASEVCARLQHSLSTLTFDLQSHYSRQNCLHCLHCCCWAEDINTLKCSVIRWLRLKLFDAIQV